MAFMRSSNLLQSRANNGISYKQQEEEEEDPFDQYMKEINEQASKDGVYLPATEKADRIQFQKGETLGTM